MSKEIDTKLNVQFTQADTFVNITSGENISTSFGKISRWYGEIQKKIDTEATYTDIEKMFPKPYLTFQGTAPFTLATANGGKWNGTVEYSTNLDTWETWDGTTTLSSGEGNVLYLRGKDNTRFATSTSNYTNFVFTTDGTIACNGDIRRLLDYENPENTTMATWCYYGMFSGCTSLTKAPDLPATTLTSDCYNSMFKGCTSLTTLPALPAATLTSDCYNSMFYNCTNIKISTTKTGDYQTPYRIPTSGTGSVSTTSMGNMFTNTGGTFTDTPTINTTYYTSNTVVSDS